MENFLSQFANTNTEVQSNNAKLNVSAEFYGTIDISKGALNMTISFYARLYKSRYENYVSLDNWDISETNNITFNGAPIDNIDMLKTSLINSGLSTLASGLNIENDIFKVQIANQIEQSSLFKALYGKKALMLDRLSDDELKIIRLKFVIDNYDDKPKVNYELGMFLVENEEGEQVCASYGQLVEMYNQLTK